MNGNLLNKLISGTSGLFDTINKILPLYEEIKPLYKKIIDFKEKFKGLNVTKYLDLNKKTINNNDVSIKKEEKYKHSSSNPQFFL